MHSKGEESTGKKKKKSKKNLEDVSDEKVSKLISIASTIYLIAVGLQKKEFKTDEEIFKSLQATFQNCLNHEIYTVSRIAAEGLCLFYKPYLTKDPDFLLAVISEYEQQIEKEQDPKFEGKVSQSSIMLLGSMLRNYDFELNPEIQSLIT